MQNKKSDFQIGLFFISTAVLFWGMLPIALKLSTSFTDAISLTWMRFMFALVFSLIVQASFGRLNQFKNLVWRDWLILTIASVLLVVNYVTFVWGLDYLSPGVAQLNFQTAPFYLAIGGLVFFREKISLIQSFMFASLALGMLIFFHPQLTVTTFDQSIIWGIMLVQLSSFAWCLYALIQKSLHHKLTPANILLFIFGIGVILLYPNSNLQNTQTFDLQAWLIILFCSINTIVAYGCFAQSMKYWPTVQVSAMIALTPIASFACTLLCVYMDWWPKIIVSDPLDSLSVTGIVIVVLSAAGVQLMSKKAT